MAAAMAQAAAALMRAAAVAVPALPAMAIMQAAPPVAQQGIITVAQAAQGVLAEGAMAQQALRMAQAAAALIPTAQGCVQAGPVQTGLQLFPGFAQLIACLQHLLRGQYARAALQPFQ